MSFDPITYAMAKAYSDSKGGYIEEVTLTYDGNEDGKETFLDMNGVNYVRIGNVIDIHEITAVTLNDTEIKASDLEFTNAGGDDIVLYSGVVGIYVFTNDRNVPAGTYVLDDGEYVITKVVTETIHPIDPKFLPNVEIDLITYRGGNDSVSGNINNEIMYLVGNGGGTATVNGEVSLWDDVSVENPLVIKLSADSASIYVHEPIMVTHPTDGKVLQICFSALMYHAQMGLLDIKVSINRDSDTNGKVTNGAVINVKVN